MNIYTTEVHLACTRCRNEEAALGRTRRMLVVQKADCKHDSQTKQGLELRRQGAYLRCVRYSSLHLQMQVEHVGPVKGMDDSGGSEVITRQKGMVWLRELRIPVLNIKLLSLMQLKFDSFNVDNIVTS